MFKDAEIKTKTQKCWDISFYFMIFEAPTENIKQIMQADRNIDKFTHS